MVVLTRQEKLTIFDHIVKTIGEFDDDKPQAIALADQGYDTLDDFLSIDINEVSTWTYSIEDPNDNTRIITKKLLLAHISCIKHLFNYVNVIVAENNGVLPSVADWQSFTNSHFLQYMSHPRAAPVTPQTIAASGSSSSPIAAFKKGNKRDLSLYPVLNDMKLYSSWRLTFDALATKDGFGNILNKVYKPPQAEQEFFQEQQNWMFAVAVFNLLHTNLTMCYQKQQ